MSPFNKCEYCRFYSDSEVQWGGFQLQYSTFNKDCGQESPCTLGGGDCGNDNCAGGSSKMDCCEMEIYKGEKY